MEYFVFVHAGYKVRHWMPKDKQAVCEIVQKCLQSYGLHFEPEGEDIDVVDVERYYIQDNKGEFWVVVDEATNKIVGTAAYYEVIDNEHSHCENKRPNAVEIRKMYLLPEARGKKLGWSLLKNLEDCIAKKGYQKIFIKTATVLSEACKLYQSAGYCPVEGLIKTERCDQKLCKLMT